MTPPRRAPLEPPVRVRVAYGASDLGASLTFVAVNTWLLYVLVNVAGIPPVWAGFVFVVGRLVDAVTDPVMGVLADRWRDRFGRLPFVRWGALPLAVTFAAVWWAPALGPTAALAYAIVSFVVFGVAYTVVQVPTMALTPELARDYDGRTALTSWRIGFGVVASMLAVAVPPLVVLAVAGGGDLAAAGPEGWRAVGVVFGLVALAAYLTTGFGVPEPKRTPAPDPPGRSEGGSWTSAFRSRGFAAVWALFLVVTIGLMIVNSMLPFFLESALRLPGEAQTLVLGLLFGTAVLAFPAWGRASEVWGKRAALTAGLLVLAGAVWALVAFAPPGAVGPLLLGLTVLAGVGLAAVMMLPWAMLPDVVEFDALAVGRRREGLLYALFTFGQKAAGSVGVFANALVASAFGYVQGSAVQSDATVVGLRLMTGPVAAAVFVAAVFLVWAYPITRAGHAAARIELAARDAAAAANLAAAHAAPNVATDGATDGADGTVAGPRAARPGPSR
jgi:glycoside/pentoside/hexuronide:cation symporter, GPH family